MMIDSIPKYAIFTIDTETFSDTGCVQTSSMKNVEYDMLDGLDRYISLLEKKGIKATLFAVEDTAKAIADKLREYASKGHEIALHGLRHLKPTDMTNDEFRFSLAKAKEEIEGYLGVNIKGFRAPFFALDDEKLKIVRELGFRYDSSIFNSLSKNPKKKIDTDGYEKIVEGVWHDGDFFEFEMPAEDVLGICNYPVSGGAFFRIGPWNFVKNITLRYIKHSVYFVFYLHPFELSREPLIKPKKLKFYDKLYLSVGFNGLYEKIEALIDILRKTGFQFVTFEEYIDILKKQPS